MSSYEYTSPRGNKITICESAAPGLIWAAIADVNGISRGANINNADVPTVAAELLKAAGQESVIVPKSKEEVEDFGHGYLRCGLTDVGFASSSEWARDRAAELLAIAGYRDATAAREAAEKAEAEAAEKKLQERRDALAKKYHGLDFVHIGEGGQRVVNDIIELQDKLAGASRD